MVLYFGALIFISYLTSRNSDTDSFFTGNRQSPWYLVAFGMIGTSISGITFISVPGQVGSIGMSYFQVVLGYMIGYFVIGTVLMPLYYRLNLVSIYSYLEQRFGYWTYKTGSLLFLVSRTIGSSLRLYLAANVLQIFLFDSLNVPFVVTVGITILLIWVYTFRGGVKTIIWTDSFQTLFLISSLIICVLIIINRLNLSFSHLYDLVSHNPYGKMFRFEDANNKIFFPKQLIGGAFLAITMTGLDQDLMQKNLTCKNLGEAKKNLLWFSVTALFVNFLFLLLGTLLYQYSSINNIPLPSKPDSLFPLLALNEFGLLTGIFFLLGITASSYASADSALTALTTSFCIDFLNFENKTDAQKTKQKFNVHVGFSVLFFAIIIIFSWFNNSSLVGVVLTAAGYTYGPLLALFSFGLFHKNRMIKDKLVPFVCVLCPVLVWFLDANSQLLLNGYQFGYELVLINGIITYLGLWLIIKKESLII